MSAAKLCFVVLIALAAPFTLGAPAPLEAVTRDLMSRIRLDLADPAGARIQAHIDFPRMTRGAVARSWQLASPAQQEALAAEFRTLVLRTYAIALAGRRDHSVEFKPLRVGPADTEATLKSVLGLPGSPSLAVDYDLEHIAAAWKITDIKIGGISLVTNYRQVFAGQVRDAGVDGLLRALAEANRPAQGRARAQGTDFYVPVALAYATTARQIFLSALRRN